MFEISFSSRAENDPTVDDLFHRPEFFELHTRTRTGVYCRVSRQGATAGVIHALEMSSGVWHSPGRGTYGGLWRPRDSDADDAIAQAGYAGLFEHLRARGAHSITVVLPPRVHAPEQWATDEDILARLKFSALPADVHHSISIDERPLAERVSGSKAYDLRRARRLGMTVDELMPAAFAEAHDLLAESRARRGLPLTMTLDALRDMHNRLPGRVRWLGAHLNASLVGTMVLMRLQPDLLYVAYPGERADAARVSPVTVLFQAAYDLAQRERVRLLDYGTSSIDGVPLPGLAQYKEWLGCSADLRRSWRWDRPIDRS